ncbi:MAG: DNA polymerase III subunit beta [bacterium]
MNILIDKSTLQNSIFLAGKFVMNKFASTTHLQGVLIKAEKNQLHIVSTDLNLYYHKKIKIKESGTAKIIIEPKTLIEYLSFLPSGEIELEIKENQLIIKKEKDRGVFPIIEAVDFPPLPRTEKEKGQKINIAFLIKNLPLVLFSSSTDESRPPLTGINFLTQDNELLMVSTDGFRLSLVRKNKEIEIPEILIPGRFLEEVLKEAKEEKEIELYYSKHERVVLFKVGNSNFYSRLIEGEFPDFEKVIPTEYKTRATFEREDFLQKVRRVAVFAREYSNIIICEIKKGGIHISPKTEEKTLGSEAFQEAEIEGEDQKVAFNFRFIFDLLNNIKGKRINMEVLRSDAPVVFKEDGKKDFVHIIMPIRISG